MDLTEQFNKLKDFVSEKLGLTKKKETQPTPIQYKPNTSSSSDIIDDMLFWDTFGDPTDGVGGGGDDDTTDYGNDYRYRKPKPADSETTSRLPRKSRGLGM